MMHRRDLLTALPAVAAVRPPQRHPSTPQPSTLTFGQATGAFTLDPVHGSFTLDPGGTQAALCLYDGLLSFDAAMRVIPQLATSYEMADNLMSCRLKLRPRARFHDGTPVDADAVKLNLERLMSKQRNPTNRQLWDKLAAVETPDPGTVIIHTSAPYHDLPNALAHPSGVLVSPAAVETFGDLAIATNPIGAGPYRLASFDRGRHLELEAFEGYWAGRPDTARLIFETIPEPTSRVESLRANRTQVIDAVPIALARELEMDPTIKLTAVPGLRTMGFAINLTKPPFADRRVREALNLATPVEAIVTGVFAGYARVPDSPLAFNTIGYAPIGPLAHDPAKARSLLAEAGFGPRHKLRLALLTSNGLFPADAQVADMVAAGLRDAGVEPTVTRIEGDAYWDALRQARARLRWDIALFSFAPANASGLHHLTSLFRSNRDDATIPDTWNISRYRNKEVDRLLDAAGTTADPTAWQASLAQAQALIWQDAPTIWLPVVEHLSATRATVDGLELWPAGFTVLRHVVG
jgi:ABC-type transport system substrate-binding protein